VAGCTIGREQDFAGVCNWQGGVIVRGRASSQQPGVANAGEKQVQLSILRESTIHLDETVIARGA